MQISVCFVGACSVCLFVFISLCTYVLVVFSHTLSLEFVYRVRKYLFECKSSVLLSVRLFVFMSLCVYLCAGCVMHVCVCVCIHACLCVCMCVHACMCVRLHLFVCVCVCLLSDSGAEVWVGFQTPPLAQINVCTPVSRRDNRYQGIIRHEA